MADTDRETIRKLRKLVFELETENALLKDRLDASRIKVASENRTSRPPSKKGKVKLERGFPRVFSGDG